MANLVSNPIATFSDVNGSPLSGGKVYTYASGTERQVNTYTDYAGQTLASNPIILDASGSAVIYLKAGVTYRFDITDYLDNPIKTVDGIVGATNALTPDNTPASIIQGFVNAAAASASRADLDAIAAAASAAQAKLSEDNSYTNAVLAYDYATTAFSSAETATTAATQAAGYTVNGLGSQAQGVQAWNLGNITDAQVLFATDLGNIVTGNGAGGDVIPLPDSKAISNYSTLQLRRGISTDGATTIGAQGELFYLTDTKTLQLNDGLTAGGVRVVTSTNPDINKLGTMATQDAKTVSISGGNITGVAISGLSTPLAIADGGTGVTNLNDLQIALQIGSAAQYNVGTSANNIVQLDANGKLPPVDGSQLINLPAIGGGAGNQAISTYLGKRQTVLGGATIIDPVGKVVRPAQFQSQTTAAILQLNLPITQDSDAQSPYVVTAAGGNTTSETKDRTVKISSALTWRWNTGIDAGKYYLYIDISSTGVATLGYTKLAPIYVEGYQNIPALQNAQTYFDYLNMIHWECYSSGNPATLQLRQVWRVFVGEAIISGTAITSTVEYAYLGRTNANAFIAFPNTNSQVTFTHNIGAPSRTLAYQGTASSMWPSGTLLWKWQDTISQSISLNGTTALQGTRTNGRGETSTYTYTVPTTTSGTVGIKVNAYGSLIVEYGDSYKALAYMSNRPPAAQSLPTNWNLRFVSERIF